MVSFGSKNKERRKQYQRSRCSKTETRYIPVLHICWLCLLSFAAVHTCGFASPRSSMRKVKVRYDADEEIIKKSGTKKKPDALTVDHTLDSEQKLQSQLESLHRQFKATEPLENYTLCYGDGPVTYLNFEEQLRVQIERVPPNAVLVFRNIPSIRAQKYIESLGTAESDLAVLKDILFGLRFLVKDALFAEEFIEQQGLEKLTVLTVRGNGTIQSYGLNAIRGFMGYESGLSFFLKTPTLIERLFMLVDPTAPPTSARYALELLFVLCSYGGWSLVHRAAKFTAKSKGSRPYANIIQLLRSGDYDVAVNTLTLLNSLIDNAPTNLKADKLLNRWRDLSILDIMRSSKNTGSEWKAQQSIYEANVNLSAKAQKAAATSAAGPGGAKQASAAELLEQIRKYEEQQPMLKLLYAELHHYQTVLQQAFGHGGQLSYNSPLERFDAKRDALASPVQGPLLFPRRLGVGGPQAEGSTGRGAATKAAKEKEKENRITQSWKEGTVNKVTEILEAPAQGDTEKFRMSALVRAGALATPKQNANATQNQPTSPSSSPGTKPSSIPDLPPPDMPAPPAPPKESTLARPQASGSSTSGVSFGELEELETLTSGGNKIPLPPPISGAPAPPPPPPVKGLPPPPPPPGSKGAVGGIRPTKPVVKPLTKMKPLHWTRILVQPRDLPIRRVMIWDSINEVDFDQADFELHFAVKAREGYEEADKKKELGGSKGQAVRVLNVKRSNAIAVMCSKLPPTEELIQSIRNLDSNVLERQFVRALMQNMANAEELQQIREMVQPDILLDKPEQFCLLLAEIPELKKRLQCWEYSLTLEERLQDIGPPIISIQRACREIAKSPSLKVVLGMVLSMGNYLNGGHNKRGQADGYQIDALSKVMDLRDVHNKQSLAEYMVLMMKDLYPEVLRFPDEIAASQVAAKVNLKEIAGELRKLLLETKEVKAACGEIVSNTDSEDPFLQKIPPFMESAVEKLANIRNDLVLAEKVFEELLKYFGSTEDSTETFFGFFASFAAAFRNCVSKLETKKGRGKMIGGGGGGADDPMANIIANIKAGKARKAAEGNH